MPLEWSEPRAPDGEVSYYTYVITSTPLGPIILEWKGWKDDNSPCGHMPWPDCFVFGDTLDAAKAAAQAAWDDMAIQVSRLATKKEG